jgi:hypothetical protein
MKNQIHDVKTSKDYWKPRNNKIFKRAKKTYIHESAFFFLKKIGEMSPKSENKIQNSKMKWVFNHHTW